MVLKAEFALDACAIRSFKPVARLPFLKSNSFYVVQQLRQLFSAVALSFIHHVSPFHVPKHFLNSWLFGRDVSFLLASVVSSMAFVHIWPSFPLLRPLLPALNAQSFEGLA